MLKNVYDLNETQRGYRARWREETRCKHSQQKKRERNNFFFFFCQLWFYVVQSVTNKKKWVHMMTTNRLYRGGDVTCTMRVTSTTKAVRKVGANRNHKTAIRQA